MAPWLKLEQCLGNAEPVVKGSNQLMKVLESRKWCHLQTQWDCMGTETTSVGSGSWLPRFKSKHQHLPAVPLREKSLNVSVVQFLICKGRRVLALTTWSLGENQMIQGLAWSDCPDVFHCKFMFISFLGRYSNPASLCLCFQPNFGTVPKLSWVSTCLISFWLLLKSEDHRNLCINIQIFKATKGTQIAEDNTSRLHHTASKQFSDTLGKHSFERRWQSIRHITNEISISSPRSDAI